MEQIESALKRTPEGGVINLYTGTSPVELHYNGPGKNAHGSKTLSQEVMAGTLPQCGNDNIDRQIVLLDYVRLARRPMNITPSWCGGGSPQQRRRSAKGRRHTRSPS